MKRKYDPFDPELLIKVAQIVIDNGGAVRLLKPSFGKFFGKFYPIVTIIAWREKYIPEWDPEKPKECTEKHFRSESAFISDYETVHIKVFDKDGKAINIKWFSRLERLLNVLQTQLKNGQACKVSEPHHNKFI